MSASIKPATVTPAATISTPLTDTTQAKLFLHMPNTITKSWYREVDHPQQNRSVIDPSAASLSKTAVAGITLVINFDSVGCDTPGAFLDLMDPPTKAGVERWQSASHAWVAFENSLQRAVDQLNNSCRSAASKSGMTTCDRLQPLLVVSDMTEGLHGTLDALCGKIPEKFILRIAGNGAKLVSKHPRHLEDDDFSAAIGITLREHNSEEFGDTSEI